MPNPTVLAPPDGDHLVAAGATTDVSAPSAPAPGRAARPRRLTKAPVAIRRGNVLPILTNDVMSRLLASSGEKLP